MHRLKHVFYFSKVILLSIIITRAGWAVPLDLETQKTTLDQGKAYWEDISAENAFNAGLLQTSESIYKRVLAKAQEGERKDALRYHLAEVLINQGKFYEAEEVLNDIKNPDIAKHQLLTGILYYNLGDLNGSKKTIKEIDEKQLSKKYEPWLLLLKGLIAQADKDFKGAKKNYDKALECDPSTALRSHIDILLFRLDIHSGKLSEKTAKKLRRKATSEVGKPGGANSVKQYAIVLDLLGKKDDALEALNNALRTLPFNQENERDSLMLLKAMIAGPYTDLGQRALEDILKRGTDPVATKIALGLMPQTALQNDDDTYFNLLNNLINQPGGHPVEDNLLIQRASLALKKGQLKIAEEDARYILNHFPGSSHKKDALKLLAYSAWKKDPPQYRLTANYLTQIINEAKTAEEQDQLLNLVGDAYFLNKDYANASHAYQAVVDNGGQSANKGAALFQLVVSQIKLGNLVKAEKLLDYYRHHQVVDSISLWRSEWNLVNNMKLNGNIEGAFNRIQGLISEKSLADANPELSLRLMWLKAQLSFESGNKNEVPRLVDQIIELASRAKPETLDKKQKELIVSQALLLKAQSLLESEAPTKGLDIIEVIKTKYKGSKAAIMAYIIEARYYSSNNMITKAQQQLIELSDKYPDSEYVTIALYEAALNAEARGINNTYQEALGILERLCRDYPEGSLVYTARLKQGDILRKMGKFGDAEIVYDNLIKTYPMHPLRGQSELSRTDCLMAQAGDDVLKLKEVAMRYERLMELSTLDKPLQVEAGFKMGFALSKAKDWNQAREAYWTLISKFLTEDTAQSASIGGSGRYWVARAIFELGKHLEEQGELKEAQTVYKLVEDYNLPGKMLAESKLKI